MALHAAFSPRGGQGLYVLNLHCRTLEPDHLHPAEAAAAAASTQAHGFEARAETWMHTA